MNKYFKIKSSIMTLLLCSGIFSIFSLTIFAEDHNNALALVKSGDIVPLATILKSMQKLEQGNIIEVELEQKQKRFIYEIELVNKDGIVKKYIFDAKNGELIKEKFED